MNLAPSRRDLFAHAGTALAGVGLAHLLAPAARGAEKPHHSAKAKRVLHVFCPGAASHIDLWDHKPELAKRAGQTLPGEEKLVSFQGANGGLFPSPWKFAPAGESGKLLSALLPHVSKHADDIAFVHSMTSKTNTHGPGCVFMNTGHAVEGFPSAGAWASYALGAERDDLPAFVALPDVRGEPPNGKANWSNGFLPAAHQGIMMSAQEPVRNLTPPKGTNPDEQRAALDLLTALNKAHAETDPGNSELRARIAAYELAGKMQLSAPEVTDLSKEPQTVHHRYGTGDPNKLKAAYAKNCLLARRLLARGVRYVSLYCSSRASGVDGLLNWDAHKSLKADYERHAPIFDQPTAALLSELKETGLLKDTLVIWTTEFGRMPTQQAGTPGRDHNPDGFTCWLMGAGVKGGTSHGTTDDFGRRAATDPATVWDFYATVLHLLGFDHTRLTWRHNGLDRRLTDVHGHVLKKLLA